MTEILLDEYRDYLDKTIRSRKNEYLHCANSVIRLIREKGGVSRLDDACMRMCFGASKWLSRRAYKFLDFLKSKGLASIEEKAPAGDQIEVCFSEYLLHLQAEGKAAMTLQRNREYFGSFLAYLDTARIGQLTDITEKVIEN
jgi:hypothetical protein